MDSLIVLMLSNALAATVIALVAAALGRLRPRRPALVHAVWLVALIKLVAPPLYPVPAPSFDWPSAIRAETPTPVPVARQPMIVAEAVEEPPAFEEALLETRSAVEPSPISEAPPVIENQNHAIIASLFLDWQIVVVAIAAAGALAIWTLAGIRIVRFERLLSRVGRPAPGEWLDQASELAALLCLSRSPSMIIAPGRVPLMLWWGFGRPRLIVPAALFETLDSDERGALLLHELAHFKRGDHWVRWFELVVCGLYWWHPAAWWMRRRLREAEEECCDAWVVWATPEGAKTYANALLAAIDFVSTSTPLAAASALGGGRGSLLKRRFCMIMQAKTSMRLNWPGRLAVVAGAVLLLPLAPTWARQDEPRAVRPERPEKPLPPPDINAPSDDEATPDDDQELRLREAAERLEDRAKELVDKLVKEAAPLKEEVQKSLERALDHIQRSLKDKDLSLDSFREAVDRSADELRGSLESGGPVEREAREAWDRARKELHEMIDKSREDLRMAARDRVETRRELRQERRNEQPRARGDEDLAQAKRELREARAMISRLERQLREANRRLEALERTPRPRAAPREETRGRTVPLERPELPGKPEPPGRPDQPENPGMMMRGGMRNGQMQGGAAGGMGPMMGGGRMMGPDGRPMGPGGPGPMMGMMRATADQDRRLHELESKMDLLLKELSELKKAKSAGGN